MTADVVSIGVLRAMRRVRGFSPALVERVLRDLERMALRDGDLEMVELLAEFRARVRRATTTEG